jgi:hypothetical protein
LKGIVIRLQDIFINMPLLQRVPIDVVEVITPSCTAIRRGVFQGQEVNSYNMVALRKYGIGTEQNLENSLSQGHQKSGGLPQLCLLPQTLHLALRE